MSTNAYNYFDELYFQDGKQRGTAYLDYRKGARESKTFREIAYAIKEVFQPTRVLDVGCATGTIVRWLNELGCEAHGIDVSEWAVDKAEHPNVKLSPADNLKFPDGFFDLVISCHSLEHLPDNVFERSLAEINRVASAFHFHLLPMVGTPPYDGDPSEVRQQLRKDPTHQQLHSKGFWIDRFSSLGCVPIETCLLIKNETSTSELSIGQFLLKKSEAIDESMILKRARVRNQRVFRDVQLVANSQPVGSLGVSAAGTLVFKDRIWKDVERRLESPDVLNLVGKNLQLVLIVQGNSCNLRFAAGQDTPSQQYAHVGEFHLTAKPGCNSYSFSVDQLRVLRGEPNYAAINHLGLGGENENSELIFYLADEHGAPLLA